MSETSGLLRTYERTKLRNKIAGYAGVLMAAATLIGSLESYAKPKQVTEVETVTIERGVMRVNRKPFFPIMAWAQCAENVSENVSIGVNAFMDTSCNDEQALAEAVGNQAYIIAPINSNLESTSRLIGFNQPDEPDGYGVLPERLALVNTSLPVFQTFTAGFTSNHSAPPAIGDKNYYKEYLQKANFFGFDDYYWNNYSCTDSAQQFGAVYDEQQELVKLATGRPTYQWIEVNKIASNNCPNPVNPEKVKAEIWLAIAGGAEGIGYFTHAEPLSPTWDYFSVAPEIAQTIKAENQRITELTDILLAKQLPVKISKNSPIKVGVRKFKDLIFIIAVNSSERTINTSFRIENLGSQVIKSLGSNKQIQSHKSALNDSFEPLAVHFYTAAAKPGR